MNVMLLFALLINQGCKENPGYIPAESHGTLQVPSTIKTTHDSLLKSIRTLTSLDDSTGAAGSRLYDIMKYHFSQEEQDLFPSFGLLPDIAQGKIPDGGRAAIEQAEKFKANSAKLFAEHQMIDAYLQQLISAAEKENHPGAGSFNKQLKAHAREEEGILFPAVIVLADYLKLKSGK